MVICLERGADLHMAQLIPLPLTVSCSSRIQIGFTFLVPADVGSPGQRAVKRVCVCGVDKPTKRSYNAPLFRSQLLDPKIQKDEDVGRSTSAVTSVLSSLQHLILLVD